MSEGHRWQHTMTTYTILLCGTGRILLTVVLSITGGRFERGCEHLHCDPSWRSALEIVVEHEIDAFLFRGSDPGAEGSCMLTCVYVCVRACPPTWSSDK